VAELPKNATYLEEDDETETGTDSGQQQGGGTSGSVEEQP
jgi:hypothetical protein